MHTHVIAFDDFPHHHAQRGNVGVVGAVFAGLRFEGVLHGSVRRDGANAARTLTRMIDGSKFRAQLQLILLQGIAFAGFNVVDVHALHRALGLPVLVVARRAPDLGAMEAALRTHVRGGERKWRLITQLGPMEPVAQVWVQRVGLSLAEADAVVRRLAVNGNVPEPLRVAHLIASGIGLGETKGRV